MRKLEVRISEDQRQELKRLAQRSGLSRADLVRQALNRFFENPQVAVLVPDDRRAAA